MDKKTLFVPNLATGTHELEGVGTFAFRSLSRSEVLAMRKLGASGDIAAVERKILAAALTDPVLSESEARQWQDASAPNVMEPLLQAIMRLSGMLPEAMKDGMSTFPDGS